MGKSAPHAINQMPMLLRNAAYHAQNAAWFLNTTALQLAIQVAGRQPPPKLPASVLAALSARRKALYAQDLRNVDDGMYPASLLFDYPYLRYAKALPALLRDVPHVSKRRRANNYQDIPTVDKAAYPAYYRRNFHWQTDGYFSEASAAKYDLGVEILFHGTADMMRRQIVPPVTRFVRAQPRGAAPLRLLDVACGTGRALASLAAAHQGLAYTGIDLSESYTKHAAKALAGVGQLRLDVGNAEAMPYADASFDVVTCVYLFHELPRNARRKVLTEIRRVVRPGGLVVLQDAAQYADSPALAPVLELFPQAYHEPFFLDYLADDLAAMATEIGLRVDHTAPHLVAKVVEASVE